MAVIEASGAPVDGDGWVDLGAHLAVVPPVVSSGRQRRRRLRRVGHGLVVVAVMVAVMLAGRRFVVDEYTVDGGSMRSTLQDGDRVLVNRLAYLNGGPERGDVVVIDAGAAGGLALSHEPLIKRVIGLPGDTVRVDGCAVSIDGVELDEPYLDRGLLAADGCGPSQPPVVVPAGHVFVLGDHRGASLDSRMFGPVDDGLLTGRAFVVIWPHADWAAI